MKLYMWTILQKDRFDNHMYNSSTFRAGGGYILANNTDEADSKILKHFGVGSGRIEYTDMRLDLEDLKIIMNSQDKLLWKFHYGEWTIS